MYCRVLVPHTASLKHSGSTDAHLWGVLLGVSLHDLQLAGSMRVYMLVAHVTAACCSALGVWGRVRRSGSRCRHIGAATEAEGVTCEDATISPLLYQCY